MRYNIAGVAVAMFLTTKQQRVTTTTTSPLLPLLQLSRHQPMLLG